MMVLFFPGLLNHFLTNGNRTNFEQNTAKKQTDTDKLEPNPRSIHNQNKKT